LAMKVDLHNVKDLLLITTTKFKTHCAQEPGVGETNQTNDI